MRVSRSVKEGKGERERNIGPMISDRKLANFARSAKGQPSKTGPNCAARSLTAS